jgi:hypothetical protein
MLPRCFALCTLILVPSLAGVAQSFPNLRHFGRNIVVGLGQTVHDASCFLCSAEVDGHTTGSVHVFAGNVFLNGSVAGNVLVFGGNLTLSGTAAVGGHVLIFGGHMVGPIGGHLHQESGAIDHPPTILGPIIFLPIILVICVTVGALIVLTRRMVRGPVSYPPLPRL